MIPSSSKFYVLENLLTVPQKAKPRVTSNSTYSYIFRRNENVCPPKNLYKNVNSSIINNSQKVETSQMPMDCWMDKEKVVYPCNGLSFGNEKEWGTDTCYHMDKTWKHYAKWKKPVTKDHVLYDSIYMKCPE